MEIALYARGEVKDEQYAEELVRQLRMWFGLSSIKDCWWAEPRQVLELDIRVLIALPADGRLTMEAADAQIDAEVVFLREKVHQVIQARDEIRRLTGEES